MTATQLAAPRHDGRVPRALAQQSVGPLPEPRGQRPAAGLRSRTKRRRGSRRSAHAQTAELCNCCAKELVGASAGELCSDDRGARLAAHDAWAGRSEGVGAASFDTTTAERRSRVHPQRLPTAASRVAQPRPQASACRAPRDSPPRKPPTTAAKPPPGELCQAHCPPKHPACLVRRLRCRSRPRPRTQPTAWSPHMPRRAMRRFERRFHSERQTNC